MAEAKKRQIELDPAKGADIATEVAAIVGVPASVVKRLQDVTEPMD
jgi:hypothetical protein